MKKAYLTILAAAFVGITTATAFIIMSSRSESDAHQASMCAHTGQTRTLAIQGGAFSPEVLTVERCDRIKVVNKDNAARLIALGEHDNHIDYPGFKEKSLGSGDSFTFTAHVTGRYHMHDHVHDSVEADITIR